MIDRSVSDSKIVVFRFLENEIHKTNLKLMEGETIKKKYSSILDMLKKERLTFTNQLEVETPSPHQTGSNYWCLICFIGHPDSSGWTGLPLIKYIHLRL